MVIDRIANENSVLLKKPFFKKYKIGRGRIEGKEFILVKPLTFMNMSGTIFPELLKKFRISAGNLIVVCDNLDLPLGICRIKRKGSHGGHNGLRSIIDQIGSNDFLRLFVGIGRPKSKSDIVSYVLSRPDSSEFPLFLRGVERAAGAAVKLITRPPEEVMNECNRRVAST